MEEEDILENGSLSDISELIDEARKAAQGEETDYYISKDGEKYEIIKSDGKFLGMPNNSTLPWGGDAIKDASEMFRLTGPDWNIKDQDSNYMSSLAANQTFGEQWVRGMQGFGKQFISGIVDSVAAWDMEGLYNVAAGNAEEEYGNWLNESVVSKWGKDMEGLDIYQQGDSLFDMAYWAKAGQSLGYTGGIIAEMIAEQVALSALTGGAGNVAGLASKARLLKMGGQGAFGMFKGIQEGYMNALETQEQVFNKYKELGYDEETAKMKANEAATLGFRTEVGPLMALNSLQFMSTFGTAGKLKAFGKKPTTPELGFSGAFEKIGSSLYSPLTNRIGNEGIRKTVNKGLGFLTNAASESVEEGIQTFAGQYAEHETLKESGDEFGDMDVWTPEMRDSMVQGFLGGALFGAAFKGFNYLTQNTNIKKYSLAQENFVKNASKRTMDSFKSKERVYKDLIKAEQEFAKNKTEANKNRVLKLQAKAEQENYKSQLTNTANALQLDYITGKDTAFQSHIEQMERLQEAVNNQDLEYLKKAGILNENGSEKYKGSIETIKNTFEESIADSYKIKELMENNLLNVTSDFNSALDITRKEFSNAKMLERALEIDTNLEQAYSVDNYMQQLSPSAQNRFKLENELDALRQVQNNTTTQTLSTEDITRMKEIEESLQDIPEYTSKEKRVVANMNKKSYIDAEVSKISLNQTIDQNNADLNSLKDPNKLREKIKREKQEKIRKANNKEEVEEAVAEAEEAGVVDESLEKTIKDKEKEIENREKISTIDSSGEKVQKAEPQPKPNSVQPNAEIDSAIDEMDRFNTPDTAPIQMYSRRGVTDGVYTPEQIEMSKRSVEIISNKIGKPATLEDLIRYSIEARGLEITEQKFQGAVRVADAAGLETSNWQDIYDKYFEDEFTAWDILTEEESIETTNKIEQSIKKATSTKDKFNLHGEPIITPKTEPLEEQARDARTNKSKPKLAFNFQQYKREGNTFTITSKELKQGVHYVLDPEFIQVGDTLIVEVDDTDSTPITSYSKEGVATQTTWGEYKKGLDPNSDAYVNKVPMKVYKQVGDEKVWTGTYIHESTWYTSKNMSGVYGIEEQRKLAQEGYDNTVAIRRAVLNNNGAGSIEVTNREFGQVDKVNYSNNSTPITLSEATGETILARIEKDGRQVKLTSRKGIPLDVQLINDINKDNTFRVGGIADVRYVYTTPEGVRMYMAMPVLQKKNTASGNLRQQLPSEIFNTLRYATLANIVLNNERNPQLLKQIEDNFNFTISDATRIKDSIQSNTGIDIKSNLNEYASMFVRMSGNAFVLDNGDKKYLNDLQNKFSPSLFLNLFGDRGALLGASFNVDYNKLNSSVLSNKTIPTITSEGELQFNYKGYNELVKNNVYTNVRSHEITRQDGSKMWITDIQPMVNYSIVEAEIPALPTRKEEITDAKERATREAIEDIDSTSLRQQLGVSEQEWAELTEEDKLLLEQLQQNRESSNTYDSRRVVTEEESSVLKEQINTVKPDLLTDLEFRQLVNSLQNILLSQFDFNEKVKVGDLKVSLERIIEEQLNPAIDSYRGTVERFSKIPALQSYADEVQVRLNKLENVVEQQEKITGDKGILTNYLNRLFGLNIAEEVSGEEEFDSSNNYSKSFIEKDIKLAYSTRLRMSFFGVPQLRDNSNQPVLDTLTGLPIYNSPDTVELVLKDITTEIPSDWNVLMQKLDFKYQTTNRPIYNQLKNKFKDLPQDLKNEMLYKLISDKFTAHKIINSVIKDRSGKTTYSLKVIDENSSKENIRLKKQIRDNFIYDSPLTMIDRSTGDNILNSEEAKRYSKALHKYKDNKTFSTGATKDNVKKLDEIFTSLGITVSNNTIEQYLKYNDPFDTKTGLLTYVTRQLDTLIAQSGKGAVVVTEDNKNLFDLSNKALNSLIDLEITLNGTDIARSIRVAGKTLQGVIQSTSAYSILKELKSEDSVLLDTMLGIGYTENNILLQQLKENPQLRDILELSFSSPDSYKINGKKNFSETDYDKLSDTDGWISQFGLYTYTKGHVSLNNANDIKFGVDFRVGQMPFMTLSDKGRMVYMKTILLDAKDNQISIEGNGNITLDDNILEVLFEQVFQSDWNRILEAYRQDDPNVESFSEASKIFTFLPILNTLKLNGVNIHQVIEERLKQGENLPSMEELKAPVKKLISEYINNETNKKLNSNGTGIFTDNKLYYEGKLNNIDTDYTNKFKGTDLDKGRKLIAEHAVNNLLHQVNSYQMFLGDMAYYAKPRNVINSEGFVNWQYMEENYISVAEKIGQVVNKRAASLIAPGFILANSNNVENENSQYIQIQLQDVNSISPVLESLIRITKDKVTKEEENALDTIKNENSTTEEIQEAYKILEKNNPVLEPYFDMEGTDAQEYTTWKAHIDVLFRKGDLTVQEEELLKSAYNKLLEGKEVSPEELNIVMQPIKPVYTGMVPLRNSKGKVISMRPVYIKSSSFPLLPQVTRNLKLDNLRKNLEALEEREGKVVRASYQTANKIGANKTQLKVEDMYTEDLDSLIQSGKINSSRLDLDSKNYKIQQETPDKTSKFLAKNQDNYISMGSQFWKTILGNGVNHIKEPVFPNKFSLDLLQSVGIEQKDMLTGEELDKINNWVYSKFSDSKRKLLYSRLGLDENIPFSNMTREERKNVLVNVLDILKEEITTRNYPEYLKETLELVVNDNGEVELNSPLFLDSNANKFESLLVSLVSNSLIFHKLPGLGHISASSEGFERITVLEEISNDREGIVWLDGYRGKLRTTVLEDGSISESEVLIKSHFRITKRNPDGTKFTELINLTEDKYSEPIVENGVVVGRKLKLDMIDDELLSQFSFRIPTSSHQSGVILKVVGFLPPSSGDMLVVPAEHTVQLGEDYDIDKRYIYKSNYAIEENGRISKIEYQNKLSDDVALNALERFNIEDDLFDTDKETSIRIKMYENAMIDIYKSVYQSPSKEVQRKIVKPLSVGIAGNTANLMFNKLNEDKDPYFSTLSDVYQRDLLKAGADGKGGIGVHSNAVVFQSQIQRLATDDKLEIRVPVEIDGEIEYFPSVEYIGKLRSSSVIGNDPKTIDGFRDIAEQHGENQNVSTDNINEGIMIKRNENKYTMGVFALMAFRGFDLSLDKVRQNGNQPIHIPSVFMNQPIIRDYVRLMSQVDSISGDFVANKEQFVLEEILNKYNYTSPIDNPTLANFLSNEEYSEASSAMSGQTLYDSLTEEAALKNKDTRQIQLAVLQKFARFKNEASKLREIQGLINLSTSGLGVSYFDSLQRIKVLDSLPDSDIKNASKLVGEYAFPPTMEDGLTDDIDAINKLIKQGYTQVGAYYWKPTTIEGKQLIDSLTSVQDVMDIFFPYKDVVIEGAIDDILAQRSVDPSETNSFILEQKYEIMRELRAYMSTYNNAGYFLGDINEERRRLFIDTEDNISIAKIVKDIKDKKLPIADNPFIYNLTPQIKSVTEPSLLLHNNNDNTLFDEFTEYDAFERLLVDNTTELGEYNGVMMTPQKLAIDLISYALIANGQNGATGFNTLIPVKYLNLVGYNRSLKENYESLKNRPILIDTFIQQYFQHNPERAKIISNSNISPFEIETNDADLQKKIEVARNKVSNGEEVDITSILRDLKSFKLEALSEEELLSDYVSIRNPQVPTSNKFNLYKFNGDTSMYEQVQVLGDTGLNEYNANVFEQVSVLPKFGTYTPTKNNKYFDSTLEKYKTIPSIEEQLPSSLGVEGILNRYLGSANTPAKEKEFISNLLEYGDLSAKIVYTQPVNGALGQYNMNTNEIYIDPNIFDRLLSKYKDISKARDIAREVIIEEIIHSMTVREFNKYVKTFSNKTGKVTLVDNAPIFATKLVSLYEVARTALPYKQGDNSTYYSKDIYEFMAGMFVAPDYRQRLEKVEPGLIKKFLDALKDMLGSLYMKVTGTPISYKDETFNAVYDLLKNRKASNISEVGTESNYTNPMKEIIDNDKGVVIPNTVSEETRVIDETQGGRREIEDPFNCK